MSSEQISKTQIDNVWRTYMTTGSVPEDVPMLWYKSKSLRSIARILPADPRCAICYYPFSGLGGALPRSLFGLERSKLNPHLCNVCEKFAEVYNCGAEIKISMLFADVRGSTGLAEKMSAADFSMLINRFYTVTTRALYNSNSFVENLAGDGVAGYFTPGFVGVQHAQVAIETGKENLRSTGHADPDGPWIPVGIGVHTGVAYVGSVNSESGAADISVVGDTVNVAARISSQSATGEMLVSSSAMGDLRYAQDHWEKKH
jgi:adenylate cyclase